MFPTTPVLDNFNRANESPLGHLTWSGPAWNGNTAGRLVSNQAQSVSGHGGSYWTPATYSGSCELYATLAVVDTLWLYLDWSPSTNTGYAVRVTPGSGAAVIRYDSGTSVGLTAVAGAVPAAGTSYGIAREGNDVVSYEKVTGGSWTETGRATDITYMTGRVAFEIAAAGAIDDFGGGETVVTGGGGDVGVAGTVQFFKTAGSDFDVYTGTSDPTVKAWINAHFWRMLVYSPYFDNKTSWFARGWVYRDSYAIYTSDSALIAAHPEWILKDASNNKLYIPFGCSGGTCPQYAADIGNPAYRAYWITGVQATLAEGYIGVFADDVNMNFSVSDGTGTDVAPQDPRTGTTMTWDAWRNYMATFMEELRAAVSPAYEIIHNSVWYAGPGRTADPYVQRQIAAADYIEVERGIADPGITGGSGSFSLTTLLAYVDYLHSQGKGAMLDGSSVTTNAEREYELAGYFLISTGRDGVSTHEQTPDNWWSGYDTALGASTGPRYTWGSLLRRDFAGGMVLLNEPGATSRTVALPGTFRNTSGVNVTSVTLGAESAAVLVSTVVAAPPPAPSGLVAVGYPAQVNASWGTVSGATSYKLYRKVSGGSYGAAIYSGSAATYVDTAVTGGTTYVYKVTAVNGVGESAASAEASATPSAAVPPAPAGFGAAGYPGQINMLWSAVTGATSYKIYRKVSGGSYGTALATVSAPGTGYADTTATPGTAYTYRVTALNAVGEGPPSPEWTATATSPLPAAPSPLTETSGIGQVALSWPKVTGATSYKIYRRLLAGPYGAPLATPGPGGGSTESYTDATVASGVSYAYSVSAVNAAGEGPVSNEITGTGVVAVPTAPPLTITSGVGAIALDWGSVAGATGYSVYRRNGGGYGAPVYAGPVAEFVDTAVVVGVVYTYRVTATNSAGEGPASGEASGTLLAPGGDIYAEFTVPGIPSGPVGGYAVRLGPLEFVTTYNTISEALGDGYDAVGAAIVATDPKPRAFTLGFPVRGAKIDVDPAAAGNTLRLQVRALLENPVVRASGLYFRFDADPALNGWLMVGGGDLTYADGDGGAVFGEYKLELTDCYLVGRQQTHRRAVRAEILDKRLATSPRDTRRQIYATDFASAEVAPRLVLPAGIQDLETGGLPVGTGMGSLVTDVTTSDGDVTVIDQPTAFAFGLTDGRVYSFEQSEASMGLSGVKIFDQGETPDHESTWTRVVGGAQPLTADTLPVLDNGLCRLVPCNAQGVYAIQAWLAGWVEQARVYVGSEAVVVSEWTPERATLTITQALTTNRQTVCVTLDRGATGPTIELYMWTATPPGLWVQPAIAGAMALTTAGGSYTLDSTTHPITTAPWATVVPPSPSLALQFAWLTAGGIHGSNLGTYYPGSSRIAAVLGGITGYTGVAMGMGPQSTATADATALGKRTLLATRAVPTLIPRG